MAHVRKQIRDAVATELTGLTTTGSRVFKGRFYPIQNDNLPALCIYTADEEAELGVIGTSRGSDRILVVTVEAYAKSKTIVEDTLDTIAVEVEEAMSSDTTLGGLSKDIMYTGFDLDADADGEQTVAVLRLNFSVRYRVAENDVETAI